MRRRSNCSDWTGNSRIISRRAPKPHAGGTGWFPVQLCRRVDVVLSSTVKPILLAKRPVRIKACAGQNAAVPGDPPPPLPGWLTGPLPALLISKRRSLGPRRRGRVAWCFFFGRGRCLGCEEEDAAICQRRARR